MTDTVLYNILVSKLEKHGFDGYITEWIKELAVWSPSKSCSEQLSVQEETKWGDFPQQSVLGSVLLNIFVSDVVIEIEYSFSKFSSNTKPCCQHAVDMSTRPEGPCQASGVGLYKTQEVQQCQIWSPAPELGQSQAQIQVGQEMDWEQLWGEGLGAFVSWKALHEVAVCTCNPKS